MLYIILLFVIVYLMMLMRRQKEKMSEIKIQIDQLQAQHDRLQKEKGLVTRTDESSGKATRTLANANRPGISEC